jgi:hypothetical protein
MGNWLKFYLINASTNQLVTQACGPMAATILQPVIFFKPPNWAKVLIPDADEIYGCLLFPFRNKQQCLKRANRPKGRDAKPLAYVRAETRIGQQGCQATPAHFRAGRHQADHTTRG